MTTLTCQYRIKDSTLINWLSTIAKKVNWCCNVTWDFSLHHKETKGKYPSYKMKAIGIDLGCKDRITYADVIKYSSQNKQYEDKFAKDPIANKANKKNNYQATQGLYSQNYYSNLPNSKIDEILDQKR